MAHWDDGLLEPPAVEVADVRAVTVASDVGVPARLPGWLTVLDGAPAAWEATAQALWPASPHYRERVAGGVDFRAAGAAALHHAVARGEIAEPVTVVRGNESTRGPLEGCTHERPARRVRDAGAVRDAAAEAFRDALAAAVLVVPDGIARLAR